MAYTVTITGGGDYLSAYVAIDGRQHIYATTLTVNEGTEVIVYAVGGVSVYYADGSSETIRAEYIFTISTNVTVKLDMDSATVTHETSVDPETSYDGHKTNIGGVAYQIESGTVLYGGAAYEIELGMTLVNGVGYEIPFGAKTATVEISIGASSYSSSNCYATVGGTKYTSAQTLEVEIGTEVVCYVKTVSTSYAATIYYNDKRVVRVTGANKSDTYTFTVEGNTSIVLAGSSAAGSIEITTE